MPSLVRRICRLSLASTIVFAARMASPAATDPRSPPSSSAAFTWETVLSLPHDPKHGLGNVWVFEGGEAFAVGNEIVAHCTSNGRCDITKLTGGEVLWDVWSDTHLARDRRDHHLSAHSRPAIGSSRSTPPGQGPHPQLRRQAGARRAPNRRELNRHEFRGAITKSWRRGNRWCCGGSRGGRRGTRNGRTSDCR
jgi:hypothetical protein